MILKKIFILILFIFLALSDVKASESASAHFSVTMPAFLEIKTLSSAVLTANITDKTGNLYAPLSSKFRVVSNDYETKTLYLKANTLTDAGYEESMFDRNGRVYIAFGNVSDKPKSQSLANCKLGAKPKESPSIVAYPVTSVIGAKSDYQRGQGKYKVYVNNGVTDITVNIGANVLKSSFADNDPKGFYQATLLLIESDI